MRNVTLADGSVAEVGDGRVSWDDAKRSLKSLRDRTNSMCRAVELSRGMPLGVGMTWASGRDGTLDRAAVGVRGLLSEPRVGEFELTEVVVAGLHETRHLVQEVEVLRGDVGPLAERLADERMVRWRNPAFWGDVVNYGRWVSEADAECSGVREAVGVLDGVGLDGERMVGEYVDVMSCQPYHALYGLGGLGVSAAADSAMARAWDSHYVLCVDFSEDELGRWLVESEDGERVRSVCAASGSDQVRLMCDVMCELCPDRMLLVPVVRSGHLGRGAEASDDVREAPEWEAPARLWDRDPVSFLL